MGDVLPNSLIGKTEKGKAAIRDRDRSLQPRARSLLIMLDGSKTAQQLAALNPDATLGMDLVKGLVADGFAEVLGGGTSVAVPLAQPATVAAVSSAPSTPPLAQGPSAPPSSPSKDLKLACRGSVRYLESIMGPGATSFALQLERCKNVGEFDAKAEEIRRLLAATHSEKRAAEFAAAAMLR